MCKPISSWSWRTALAQITKKRSEKQETFISGVLTKVPVNEDVAMDCMPMCLPELTMPFMQAFISRVHTDLASEVPHFTPMFPPFPMPMPVPLVDPTLSGMGHMRLVKDWGVEL